MQITTEEISSPYLGTAFTELKQKIKFIRSKSRRHINGVLRRTFNEGYDRTARDYTAFTRSRIPETLGKVFSTHNTPFTI
jgi:hypothetical protein